MYKNVLQSIENVDIWPIISLSIFFFFFICMTLWWWQMDKDHIKKMAKMPLEGDEDSTDQKERNSKEPSKRSPSALKMALTFLLVIVGQPLFAQSSEGASIDSTMMLLILAAAVILVSILVLVVAVYLLLTMQTLLTEEKKQKAVEAGVEYVASPSWWEKFQGELTDAVPVEKEHTIVLDHEYDGIRELDNHLPPWWKWLFYASIAWGVVYLFAYHVVDVLPLPAEEYANEVAAAEEAAAARLVASEEAGVLIDESTVEMVTDATALADGEKIYQTNCAACHKADGGGSIGPNLTDEYWIHGGGIKNIFSTVKYGVVEKGMISWEPVLSPEQMQNVSAYIWTMQGTNPPGAKAAQGEVWVEEAGESPAETDTVSVEQAMLVN